MTPALANPPATAVVRFVDASTGLDVGRQLCATAEGVSLVRDRQGLLLVTRPAGAGGDETEGAALDRVDLLVDDPSGWYLPRRFAVTLRRAARSDDSDDGAGWAGRPICVAMFLTAVARPTPGCAVLRVRVTDAATHKGLGGALVRVTGRTAGQHPRVLGRGLSDARGDALVAMRATPATIWEGKPARGATSPELDVEVAAAVDPGAQGIAGYVPDPDVLEARLDRPGAKGSGAEALATATVRQKIWWGREVALRMAIPLG